MGHAVSSTPRQNNFNLLRLVLALLVIVSHSFALVDGPDTTREPLRRLFDSLSLGEAAVDGFFLLSGYLILQSWVSDPRPWPFLKKRLLRIYPGFIAASLACAFIVGPLGADAAAYFADFQALPFLDSVLFLNIPVLPPVFADSHFPSINGSMWSISKEFGCYLFVLAAGVAGALRLRHCCLAATALVLATIVWRKLGHGDVGDLRLASFFLCGMCYYQYRERIPQLGSLALGAAVLALLSLYSWRASELVLATAGGYALLYAATRHAPQVARFNRLPDVSYGVYLYGWPAQKLLLWHDPALSPWAVALLASLAAVAAGTASWYLVEKPALRFRRVAIRLPDGDREKAVS